MSKNNQQKKRRLYELPPMNNQPCIEFSGNREVVIEGSRGVLEYSTDCIRVNTDGMVISLSGRGLNLRCISDSSLIIVGFILSVEFII
ncbi:MAG: YabP/YqfC family sporulation protein [Ruminococcus sp.]|nr:YabP/YqfC family sporulation protein [Ruminococcus sp.]